MVEVWYCIFLVRVGKHQIKKYINVPEIELNSGIFKITNLKNKKSYIGSSIDLRGEEERQFKDLNSKCHISFKLQHAYNFFECTGFVFKIIERVNEKNLSDRLQYFIELLNSDTDGYNTSSSDFGGGMTGKIHTQESINKQKEMAVGRFTMDWFIKKYGEDEGTRLYRERNNKLKNRKINYNNIKPNVNLGRKKEPLSQETKDKIKRTRANFAARLPELYEDFKLNIFTMKQLSEKYDVSDVTILSHRRRFESSSANI